MVQLLLVGGGVATALLLLLSAFFSSSETAIFSVSPEWGKTRVSAGDSRGQALETLQENPHRLLVTLLVGNNVVNIAISSIITVLVVQNLPPGAAVVATTLLTSVLVLVFGEIVPKSYGLGNAEEWSVTVAPVVALVGTLLSPIISVFDWVTRGITDRISGEIDIERPYVE
jgi:Mg2+/Co2+ transporter CorB